MIYIITILLAYVAFLLWHVSKKLYKNLPQSTEPFSPFFDVLNSAKKQVDFLKDLHQKTWDDLQKSSGEQAELKDKNLAIVVQEERLAKECLEAILEANYKVVNGHWSFNDARESLKKWREMQLGKMSDEQRAKNFGRHFPSDFI